LKVFKPAFLGRVTLVPYFPLSDAVIRQIVELQLGRIRRRIVENYKANFVWSPELVQSIADRCHEVESGARNVEHILGRGILPELSARFLEQMAAGKTMSDIRVSVDGSGGFAYDID
jgi:type VI secretion system protein VasG